MSKSDGTVLSAYGWSTVLWVSFVPLALAGLALAVVMNRRPAPTAGSGRHD